MWENRVYQTAHSAALTSAIFEVCWFPWMSAISSRQDARDVQTKHLCLDGLAFCSTLSIILRHTMERTAFTSILAKMYFIEKHRHSKKSADDIPKRLMQGDHLNLEWYRPLNLQSERNPASACGVLLKTANETKQRVNDERRQAKLRRIQTSFGSEINLIDSNRSFIKQGRLIKVSSLNKKTKYTFFLFSDVILYASDGVHTKYKMHKIIHLSLLRLIDYRGSKEVECAFALASPQKAFTLIADSREEKKAWLEAILRQLQEVLAARRHYMEKQRQAQDQKNEKEEDELLRRYSTFIGSTGTAKAGAPGVTNNWCKLCLRTFSRLRRTKHSCNYCDDRVCDQCSKQRCAIPDRMIFTKKRVCDACYGGLQGIIGDNIPLLSVQKGLLKGSDMLKVLIESEKKLNPNPPSQGDSNVSTPTSPVSPTQSPTNLHFSASNEDYNSPAFSPPPMRSAHRLTVITPPEDLRKVD